MTDEPSVKIRCLFCQSGSEQSVVRQIEQRGLGQSLYPQKTESFFRNGSWKDIQKPLLPGYVFIFSQYPQSVQALMQINGVIRLLTYDDKDQDGYLNEKDSRFAQWLFDSGGVVDKLSAVREGSYVRIVDGWLKDYNGRVEKVNRQKRIAYLSLDIIGSTRGIWLGFEYIGGDSSHRGD